MEVLDLFLTRDAIDADGRVYLSDRGVSIPVAQKSSVAARDGNLYFGLQRNNKYQAYKTRGIDPKRYSLFKPLDFVFPFFNQQDFTSKDHLIITEGELDCLTLLTLGMENVVSLPNGASSVESTFKANYDFLADYKEIYICFDNDDPGHEAASKAQDLIPLQKFRKIKLPSKDANAWLLEENPEKQDFLRLMRQAEKTVIPQIMSLKDVDMKSFSKIDEGASSSWKDLDGILGGIRQGEITVITADTGVGKTTFCVNLLYILAEQGYGCWMNAYEMRVESVYRKLASIVLGRKMKLEPFSDTDIQLVDKWRSTKNIFINPVVELVNVTSFKKLFEIAKYSCGINYVFLDHLDYLHHQERNSGQVDDIKQVMIHLHSYAIEFNIGIILVAHPRKITFMQKKLTMDDLKGSSAIKQYADNVLILTRMSRLDPGDHTTEIAVAKNRLLGIESSCKLYYNEETDRYESRFNDKTINEWLHESGF
jgi:twinkle protein